MCHRGIKVCLGRLTGFKFACFAKLIVIEAAVPSGPVAFFYLEVTTCTNTLRQEFLQLWCRFPF
jgi:hypothetical protein